MAMDMTQDDLDNSVLVLLVNEDGEYRWSSDYSGAEVATQLHRIADDLMGGEDGQ